MRFKYVLNEVLVGLWRNVTMTIAMIITMSVSLTMLGASVLMYMQVDQMKTYYYGEIQVSIFLREDVSEAQRTAINQAIDTDSLVASKTYETRAEAFEKFKVLWRDSPDFVKSVGPDSLPESFRVKLKDPEQYFEREWIRNLFLHAVDSLRERCDETNNRVRFQLFERYDLEESTEKVSYATLATEFGLTTSTVTNQLAAARRDFRKVLLEKLRQTTATDAEFQKLARELLGVDVK